MHMDVSLLAIEIRICKAPKKENGAKRGVDLSDRKAYNNRKKNREANE